MDATPLPRRPDKYRLIGKLPVPCLDTIEWAEWFEKADRQVARTQVGCLDVSTIFLSLDHSFYDHGDPMLFETMIFCDGEGQYQTRCSTWDEAEKQHAKAVAYAQAMVQRAAHLSREYEP